MPRLSSAPCEPYKWLYCGHCQRIFKRSYMERHAGHRPVRIVGDEPWIHVLYEPELLWDWLKLKVESWRQKSA